MDEESSGAALQGAGTGAASGFMVGGPWGAVIGAGVGLVGGLLSAKAKKKAKAEEMKLQGQMMNLQTQADATKNWTAGTQNAFNNMMQGYQGLRK